MRSSPIVILATAGLALAHPSSNGANTPHNHKRFHELKARQDPPTQTENVVVVGPTIAVYELDGRQISYEELQRGLKNGSLVLDKGAPAPEPQFKAKAKVDKPAVVATPSPEPTPESSAAPAPEPEPSTKAPEPSPQPAPSTKADSQPAEQSTAAAPSSYGGGSSSGSSTASTGDISRAYDNSLPCSEFPSSFGALAVPWQGMGGWIGIQTPSSSGNNGMSGIVTGSRGSGCTEGAYCSYACPNGSDKTQWPSVQGSTGQSVGGLLCKNGKLTLTRPDVPQLCSPETNQVTVSIVNKLSKNVAVCRTDYPGTESMSVPLDLAPGEESVIACPDADTAYSWQGAKTSAQYYVNPAGVSVEDACQWGSAGTDAGNWAPMNIGAGYSNGAAWLSIFQNEPTTNAKLNFKVTIISDDMNGSCSYSNGQYEGGGKGCTVSVRTGGKATYVFEDA